MALLEVKNIKTYFYLDGEALPAVDDVSFSLEEDQTIAMIGESGSGKSVLVLSIMKLIDQPGKIIHGEVLYEGGVKTDLLTLKERAMQKIRGNEIAMIYQDPMSTLNPLIPVGKQIEEALIIHKKGKKKEVKEKAMSLMKDVGIPDAEKRYKDLPGMFSGGMRQRIMIAMAIACNPKILIADEPTTALDVTIQAEILELLKKLQEEHKMSIILNTHDLGVVKDMAHEVCVMYCGKIMEKASKDTLFQNPLNPYTKGLIECMPGQGAPKEKLHAIEGYVPHPSDFPKGCRFSTRCPYAVEKCHKTLPDLVEIEPNHFVRCFLVEEGIPLIKHPSTNIL
ncbi:MAG TPA: peptide ABC transporter ATP-binding protein [Clostridiaceae bacterium]|nr:peptide ABC transporter ATP-binding protein [Clostridiaceae bacterium]